MGGGEISDLVFAIHSIVHLLRWRAVTRETELGEGDRLMVCYQNGYSYLGRGLNYHV